MNARILTQMCAARAGSAAVWMLAGAMFLLAAAEPASAQLRNERAARVLSLFDIDGDGQPDRAADSDGDGLPDSWEVGGLFPTDVAFPAPQPIVPGTAPLSIFSRRAVRTSASARDTDGDGLTDFIEVFGLKFIDDNGNGILDDACARDADGNVLFNPDGTPVRLTCSALAAGEVFRFDHLGNLVQTLPADCDPAILALDPRLDEIGEWFDFNGDGLPSIGEFPAVNILVPGCSECFDYDGFVFTDPTNPDTDGDGIPDGLDNDPLVNPASFGRSGTQFPSGDFGPAAQDFDLDNDGLGNGMDLGNDLRDLVDNPADLQEVLRVFRPDVLEAAARLGQPTRVPEGLIEDLLGADWNGDGLFRVSDVQSPIFGITSPTPPPDRAAGLPLFTVEDPETGEVFRLFAVRPFPENFNRNTYYSAPRRGPSGVDAPLPYQKLLIPSRRGDEFLPDPRIWTVLYAWRMPGFDIDGNGFIGFDARSFRAEVIVNDRALNDNEKDRDARAPSTELLIAGRSNGLSFAGLDGIIQSPFSFLCPGASLALASLAFAGFLRRGRRR